MEKVNGTHDHARPSAGKPTLAGSIYDAIAELDGTISFTDLFNSAPDCIILTDRDGLVKAANAKALTLLGTRDGLLRDASIVDVIAFPHDNAIEVIAGALLTEPSFSSGAYCTTRDGLRFPADVVVTSVTSAANTILCFFIRDATERKRIEEQLKNKSKIRGLHMLAGSVAHDFNNMLTSIVGHIELAMSTISARSRASEDLATALKDSKRMAELSRRMLDHAGRGMLQRPGIDLNTILTAATDKLLSRVPGHVIMNAVVAPSPVIVRGEDDMIETAVSNLMVNALDATEKNGGSVTASCSIENVTEDMLVNMFANTKLVPAEYASITVVDTGYGMDGIILEKIFDPFFSTKGSNRGLGLTEVQGIVLTHGGAVSVSSQMGHGTTFKILLPLLRQSSQGSRISLAGAQTPIREKRTILVIDDDPSVRRYTNRLLDKLGFIPLMAANGSEGVDQFRLHSDEIDLVIIDMFMPMMSGDEVLRQLRKIRPGVKAIIISGYAETIYMEKFKDAQPSAFMNKPFVTGDFVEIISGILKT